jgi:uncharacterized protein (DUF433 family)
MSLTIHHDPPPIRLGEDGAVRVGPTRVTLETVLYYHLAGQTPEQIVESFDTLKLADVYSAIGYYYRHKDEVDAFLRAGEAEAARWKEYWDAQLPDRATLRERLLSRLERKGQDAQASGG